MLNAKTKEPELARFENSKLKLIVHGGLHYFKSNSAPYFSLTCDGYEKDNGRWHESFGGCAHDEILKRFPRFSDLAALHGSDIDGAPTHAIENGIYHASGAFTGYDRGLGSRYFQDKPDALRIFADHCRITESEAQALITEAAKRFNFPDIKAHLHDAMEAMRPRWQAEAEACITKHGLVIYGDAYASALPKI